MTRLIFLICFALCWFVFAGLYFSGKNELIAWGVTLVIYLFGLQWVIPFLLKRKMYAVYTAENMDPNDERHKFYRVIYFLIGLILCTFSSIN